MTEKHTTKNSQKFCCKHELIQLLRLLGQMKNLLLVDPVKMVSMTILRNVNLKKYLGAT